MHMNAVALLGLWIAAVVVRIARSQGVHHTGIDWSQQCRQMRRHYSHIWAMAMLRDHFLLLTTDNETSYNYYYQLPGTRFLDHRLYLNDMVPKTVQHIWPRLASKRRFKRLRKVNNQRWQNEPVDVLPISDQYGTYLYFFGRSFGQLTVAGLWFLIEQRLVQTKTVEPPDRQPLRRFATQTDLNYYKFKLNGSAAMIRRELFDGPIRLDNRWLNEDHARYLCQERDRRAVYTSYRPCAQSRNLAAGLERGFVANQFFYLLLRSNEIMVFPELTYQKMYQRQPYLLLKLREFIICDTHELPVTSTTATIGLAAAADRDKKSKWIRNKLRKIVVKNNSNTNVANGFAGSFTNQVIPGRRIIPWPKITTEHPTATAQQFEPGTSAVAEINDAAVAINNTTSTASGNGTATLTTLQGSWLLPAYQTLIYLSMIFTGAVCFFLSCCKDRQGRLISGGSGIQRLPPPPPPLHFPSKIHRPPLMYYYNPYQYAF